jgi:hypothetical protein
MSEMVPVAAARSPRAQLRLYDARAGTVVARSAGGLAVFDGRELVIDRTGAESFILHGSTGQGAFDVRDIEAVLLRPARGRARGHMQIVQAGVGRQRGGACDENSVLFDAAHQPQFEQLAGAVREAMRTARRPVPMVDKPVLRVDKSVSAVPGRVVVTIDAALMPTVRRPDSARPLGLATEEARRAFVARWVNPAGQAGAALADDASA